MGITIRQSSPSHRTFARTAVLLASIAGGCGGEDGPPRIPVAGEVKLDGTPLANGTITFAPVDGGAGGFAQIADGTYLLGRGDGPSPGRHRVEIVSVRSSGKTMPSPDIPGETIEEVGNVIPPEYNSRTRLEVEVKPDGENRFQFELSSSKKDGKSARKVVRR